MKTKSLKRCVFFYFFKRIPFYFIFYNNSLSLLFCHFHEFCDVCVFILIKLFFYFSLFFLLFSFYAYRLVCIRECLVFVRWQMIDGVRFLGVWYVWLMPYNTYINDISTYKSENMPNNFTVLLDK